MELRTDVLCQLSVEMWWGWGASDSLFLFPALRTHSLGGRVGFCVRSASDDVEPWPLGRIPRRAQVAAARTHSRLRSLRPGRSCDVGAVALIGALGGGGASVFTIWRRDSAGERGHDRLRAGARSPAGEAVPMARGRSRLLSGRVFSVAGGRRRCSGDRIGSGSCSLHSPAFRRWSVHCGGDPRARSAVCPGRRRLPGALDRRL